MFNLLQPYLCTVYTYPDWTSVLVPKVTIHGFTCISIQVQQQQQQAGLYPGMVETVAAASQQVHPSVAAVPSNEHAVYPNASVAPQHSAPPVAYNSQQPSQLVS